VGNIGKTIVPRRVYEPAPAGEPVPELAPEPFPEAPEPELVPA
jgi:hypothetical protein